jgi:hypothetical protein
MDYLLDLEPTVLIYVIGYLEALSRLPYQPGVRLPGSQRISGLWTPQNLFCSLFYDKDY